jgi:hypothetical protein
VSNDNLCASATSTLYTANGAFFSSFGRVALSGSLDRPAELDRKECFWQRSDIYSPSRVFFFTPVRWHPPRAFYGKAAYSEYAFPLAVMATP